MELTVTASEAAVSDSTVELRVVGSLDLATRHLLVKAADTALAISKTLYVDAAGITFIDASGLGALVEIVNAARDRSATLAVTRRSDVLRQLLDLTGLRLP